MGDRATERRVLGALWINVDDSAFRFNRCTCPKRLAS